MPTEQGETAGTDSRERQQRETAGRDSRDGQTDVNKTNVGKRCSLSVALRGPVIPLVVGLWLLREKHLVKTVEKKQVNYSTHVMKIILSNYCRMFISSPYVYLFEQSKWHENSQTHTSVYSPWMALWQ
jgi:hypothetical protein